MAFGGRAAAVVSVKVDDDKERLCRNVGDRRRERHEQVHRAVPGRLHVAAFAAGRADPDPLSDTSFSNNLKSGSSTVQIGGKGAALAQKSYYKESVLGDEAATRTFGANVVTHQITGNTYFQAWCMDVKFEGKNVCRHVDITTSNHASQMTTTLPLPTIEFANLAAAQAQIDADKCPCCGEALHEWQRDPNSPNTPKSGFKAMTSSQFWQNRVGRMPSATDAQKALKTNMQNALDGLKRAQRQSRQAQKQGKPGCPNVPENETDGCAIHFDFPVGTRYPDGTNGRPEVRSQFRTVAEGTNAGPMGKSESSEGTGGHDARSRYAETSCGMQ